MQRAKKARFLSAGGSGRVTLARFGLGDKGYGFAGWWPLSVSAGDVGDNGPASALLTATCAGIGEPGTASVVAGEGGATALPRHPAGDEGAGEAGATDVGDGGATPPAGRPSIPAPLLSCYTRLPHLSLTYDIQSLSQNGYGLILIL